MWVSTIPSVITAGSTIKWRDEATTVDFDQQVTSSDWTLKYYLRSRDIEAHTVTASAYGSGFESVISASDSAAFTEGNWTYAAEVSKGSEKFIIGDGKIYIKQTHAYTGTAGKIDTRSPNQVDRDNIIAALRKFNDGAQEYSIGNRTYKRVDMDKLRTRLGDLNQICLREAKEEKLSQGLGTGLRLNARL
nr:unnamed protein product [uncultured Mediterranean phage uvMED]BAR26532.1 unnamed protein product [uncultured Mediterranean phage uvMED]